MTYNVLSGTLSLYTTTHVPVPVLFLVVNFNCAPFCAMAV